MSKPIKGLLFDKDGTLFDFHATWGVWCSDFIGGVSKGDQGVSRALAEVMDFDLERGMFNVSSQFIAGTIDDFLGPLNDVLIDWDRMALYDHVIATASAAPQQPVVELSPLLTRFRENTLKIGVATNDNEAPARAHLESVGILQAFDFVSGSDSGFGAKPEPGMLLGFCEAAGLNPVEVAMVGDSTHDLLAGRAAGMTNIGVLTGPAVAEDLAPFADVILNDIGAIPNWLGLK